MKKGLIFLFIISTFFPCIANATYSLTYNNNSYFYVQSRVKEDGQHFFRLYFACLDTNGNFATDDVMDKFELTGPNGIVPVNNDLKFSGIYTEVDGSYNDNYQGQWWYGTPYETSGYSATLNIQELASGKYTLTFTDNDNQTSSAQFTVNNIVDLPIIPSKSYKISRDMQGNFIWEWQVPYEIDPNLQTSCRAFIDVFDNNGNLLGELYVKVPTLLGRLFVPKVIFDQGLTMGGVTFGLGIQLRTNDNNNRSYSTEVPFYIDTNGKVSLTKFRTRRR